MAGRLAHAYKSPTRARTSSNRSWRQVIVGRQPRDDIVAALLTPEADLLTDGPSDANQAAQVIRPKR